MLVHIKIGLVLYYFSPFFYLTCFVVMLFHDYVVNQELMCDGWKVENVHVFVFLNKYS